jgi:acyl-ACP thioesterase
MTDFTEFKVMYNDLDVNCHLNSMKYIDHVMDTFPLDYLRSYQVKRVEIAYVAEGHWGDTLRIYHTADGEQHYFRITRMEADGNETELTRVLMGFKAKQ